VGDEGGQSGIQAQLQQLPLEPGSLHTRAAANELHFSGFTVGLVKKPPASALSLDPRH